MKKMFVLTICIWSVFVAGCNNTKTAEVKKTKVEFTSEQKKMVAALCDEKDDNDIFITTTFEDGHCYHV